MWTIYTYLQQSLQVKTSLPSTKCVCVNAFGVSLTSLSSIALLVSCVRHCFYLPSHLHVLALHKSQIYTWL